MRWASAVSTEHDLEPAVSELVARLGHELARVEPDLVLAFSAGHDAAQLERLPQLLQAWIGDGLLLGCGASGIIAGRHEVEDEPALGLLAALLTDVELTAIHLDQPALPALRAPREAWWRLTGVAPESEPSFVVLADPFSFDVEHCVRGLDRAFPGSTIVERHGKKIVFFTNCPIAFAVFLGRHIWDDQPLRASIPGVFAKCFQSAVFAISFVAKDNIKVAHEKQRNIY